MSKSWKTVATFSTYQEADNKRKLLQEEENCEVKVKRSSANGGVFRVKLYKPPVEKDKKKNKKKKKNVN